MNQPKNHHTQCGQCSKPLPGDAPGGVCPSCLMGLALNNPGTNPTAAHLSDHPFPAPRADELIDKFPGLEIEHLIGHGGMGAVYQARQTNLDRVVALKILSPKLSTDPTFTERFMREARTLAKLSHPNIVMVFDFGQADEMHYLVMELVDGVNLRDAIHTEQLSPSRALEIVPQICDALQYAHDRNVIHRDIKPENILIDKSGNVKIADFGLAKLIDPSPTDFTLTGTRQVLGTVSYMAPEQIEKPSVVDHRADIYSLGVVFYELLTGELPIGRFSLPSEKSQVSNRLDEVVMRTLEKEPGRRYQQVSQVKTDMQQAGDFDPIPAAERVHRAAEGRPANLGEAVTVTLPFTISVREGWSEGVGLARGFKDCIELDYRVTDGFGLSKRAPETKYIATKNISAARFVRGILKDRIEIQTDRMDILPDFDCSAQGKVKMVVSKADAKTAQAFVQQLQQHLPNQPQLPVSPSAPNKYASPLPEDEQLTFSELVMVKERLKVPVFGMTFAAIGHFLFVAVIAILCHPAFGGVRISIAETIGPRLREFQDGRNIDLGVDPFFWVVVTLMVIGSLIGFVILSAVARCLHYRRNYHFILAALVIAFIPLHPLAVISIPFALWTLIVVLLPTTRQAFRAEAMAQATGKILGPKSDSYDSSLSTEVMTRTLKAGILFLFLLACVACATLVISYGIAKESKSEKRRVVDTQQIIEAKSDSNAEALID